jgi:proteasome beta subunit
LPQAQFGFPTMGATTIGIVCKDGVVLASDKRIAYGFSIMSKSGKKVFPVGERIGVGFAGLISDAQAVLRRISAEVRLYELEFHKKIGVRATTKLLSNMLYSQRYYPVFTETMVAGLDEDGAKLFVLDQLGSMIEDKYAAIGSGGSIAIGILEQGYGKECSVKDGKELAIRAVRAGIARDIASGDGVDVLIIAKDGVREEFHPAK